MSSENLDQTFRTLLQPKINSTTLTLTRLPPPTLTPSSDEHLIRIHATAPCAGELFWAANYPTVANPTGNKLLVPCPDFSGVVVSAPPSSPFPSGTEVYARTSAERPGNAREYSIALTSELARKPKTLDWVRAASVPLSAITALQALFEHGELADWDVEKEERERRNGAKRVLITAASGGVGIWIVQLAKAAGVRDVVALCGTKNVEFVKSLGATEVVDYRTTNLREWVKQDEEGRKVDLVIDCVGGKTLEQCWDCVKDGATLLSISDVPEQRKPADSKAKDIRNYFFIMKPIGEQLEVVTGLLDKGVCKPVVDSVWDLEQYEEAFKKLDSGHARGKIILKIRD
ncbi:hypothetical protein GP486_000334 [Trichoglossum hirsutum]|uniref:Enoyl reductase (ER) domain-containing protein n=1 Tax=Trichoglossum hirsutum TaxID=265104 RepID=A0A9P8LJ75_9PEZI|nr:hypothetical protein GP486_000334 [Trichoglossum hirsutum]